MKKRRGFGTGSQQAAVTLKSHLVTGLPYQQKESISLVYSVRSHTISPR